MSTQVNKETFAEMIRQDLVWLAKQEPTCESAHIDTCLRWLREDGYDLLMDIQQVTTEQANGKG